MIQWPSDTDLALAMSIAGTIAVLIALAFVKWDAMNDRKNSKKGEK